MTIFYYDEHNKRVNYVSNFRVGFKYLEVKKGTVFDVENKNDSYLLFFIEGEAKVRYNEFPDQIFKANQFIFLPKSADCRGEALADVSFMMLICDSSIKLFDNTWLSSIINYSKEIKHKFISLPIREELMWFLLPLKNYLNDGVNCKHLHEIKQEEFFLLLKIYYRKEDLAELFFPVLGKSMEFRSTIMAKYLQVKSVKELASICGYSQRRFHDLFIEEFGLPPYKWIQKQKSKHIIWRLSQPGILIKDIIDEFNFTSASHFHKYCLHYYGFTPKQMRQKLLADSELLDL